MEQSKKSLLDWEIGDLCEFKDVGIIVPVEIISKIVSPGNKGEATCITYQFKRYDRDVKTNFYLFIVQDFFESQPECPTLQSLGTELKIN